MPENEFGTPDARDATAQAEKTVQEAAQYIVELGEAATRELKNRPLGSVKIPPEDRRQEYELMRDNPEHLAQFFIDNKATVEEAIQYAKEMEKKRSP